MPTPSAESPELAQTYRDCRPYLLAVAHRAGASPQDAEDAVQQAFVQVVAAVQDRGLEVSNLRGYLAVCVKNYVRSAATRRREQPYGLVDHDTQATGPLPEAQVLAAEQEQLAALAFARLPLRTRDLLLSAEVRRESGDEAAARLGMSRSGYYARLARARSDLRSQFLAVLVARRHDAARASGHPTGFEISQWARRTGGARLAREVDRHLSDCLACEAVAAEAERARAELRLGLLAPLAFEPLVPAGGAGWGAGAWRSAAWKIAAACAVVACVAVVLWPSSDDDLAEGLLGPLSQPSNPLAAGSDPAPSASDDALADPAAAPGTESQAVPGEERDTDGAGSPSESGDLDPVGLTPSADPALIPAAPHQGATAEPEPGTSGPTAPEPDDPVVATSVEWSVPPADVLAASGSSSAELPFVIRSSGSGAPAVVDVVVTFPAGVEPAQARDGQCVFTAEREYRCGQVLLDGRSQVDGLLQVTFDPAAPPAHLGIRLAYTA